MTYLYVGLAGSGMHSCAPNKRRCSIRGIAEPGPCCAIYLKANPKPTARSVGPVGKSSLPSGSPVKPASWILAPGQFGVHFSFPWSQNRATAYEGAALELHWHDRRWRCLEMGNVIGSWQPLAVDEPRAEHRWVNYSHFPLDVGLWVLIRRKNALPAKVLLRRSL